MSLSEMNKATYKAHAHSIRANGHAYTLRSIQCPLERADMAYLVTESLATDWLSERALFQRHDSSQIAFRLTSPVLARMLQAIQK